MHIVFHPTNSYESFNNAYVNTSVQYLFILLYISDIGRVSMTHGTGLFLLVLLTAYNIIKRTYSQVIH